jgi:predicted TIM-barrel fold metal-dependent hydrolase
MTGDAATVVQRAQSAGVEYTVVSPLLGLMPRGCADACAGNAEARRVVSQTAGLLQWVVLNPLQPATFDQAAEMLNDPACVGIKIHPEEHQYRISEHGQTIFRFAAELRAVVLTHSGEANSRPPDFVPFADEFPEMTLILAHLGFNGVDGKAPDWQVRAIQDARHGNIYTDTSSAQSILPGLIEWAVSEAGPDRILFGTDTPLYSAPTQRARIDCAEISDAQKRMILRENALRLLNLPY